MKTCSISSQFQSIHNNLQDGWEPDFRRGEGSEGSEDLSMLRKGQRVRGEDSGMTEGPCTARSIVGLS